MARTVGAHRSSLSSRAARFLTGRSDDLRGFWVKESLLWRGNLPSGLAYCCKLVVQALKSIEIAAGMIKRSSTANINRKL